MTKPCAGVVWRDDAEGIRQGDGASHSGPAHVAFGALDRLGPCVDVHFVAQYRPHTIAVYASPWSSPSQHSLQAGATPYLGRTLTGWTAPASPGAPKAKPTPLISHLELLPMHQSGSTMDSA